MFGNIRMCYYVFSQNGLYFNTGDLESDVLQPLVMSELSDISIYSMIAPVSSAFP